MNIRYPYHWPLIFLSAAWLFWSGCSGQHTGVTEGRLHPCPQLPNCAASVTEPDLPDASPRVQPFNYAGPTPRARQALISVIENMERSRIVEVRDNYIHAEFRSPGFGFIDDVEFLFSDAPGIIHVRSAARTGFYDFNVNKRRIENIRSLFNKKMANIMTRQITE